MKYKQLEKDIKLRILFNLLFGATIKIEKMYEKALSEGRAMNEGEEGLLKYYKEERGDHVQDLRELIFGENITKT